MYKIIAAMNHIANFLNRPYISHSSQKSKSWRTLLYVRHKCHFLWLQASLIAWYPLQSNNGDETKHLFNKSRGIPWLMDFLVVVHLFISWWEAKLKRNKWRSRSARSSVFHPQSASIFIIRNNPNLFISQNWKPLFSSPAVIITMRIKRELKMMLLF